MRPRDDGAPCPSDGQREASREEGDGAMTGVVELSISDRALSSTSSIFRCLRASAMTAFDYPRRAGFLRRNCKGKSHKSANRRHLDARSTRAARRRRNAGRSGQAAAADQACAEQQPGPTRFARQRIVPSRRGRRRLRHSAPRGARLPAEPPWNPVSDLWLVDDLVRLRGASRRQQPTHRRAPREAARRALAR